MQVSDLITCSKRMSECKFYQLLCEVEGSHRGDTVIRLVVLDILKDCSVFIFGIGLSKLLDCLRAFTCARVVGFFASNDVVTFHVCSQMKAPKSK
jgi:hypothetical protein